MRAENQLLILEIVYGIELHFKREKNEIAKDQTTIEKEV